jgi:hypothetical protein
LFLRIRNQVSQSYKTTDKLIVLYVLVFTFLNSRQEDNIHTYIHTYTRVYPKVSGLSR